MGKWLGEWQLFKVPECDIEFYVYCFFVWNKSTSLHKPTLSSSFLHTKHCYIGTETREGSRNAIASMSSPSSSPFALVIHAFAGLHQEHNQALLDMREDQERRFQTLFQTQVGGTKELFGAGWDWEIRAGGTSSVPALPAHVPLTQNGSTGWSGGPSSTSSRGPQRHVGGPRWTGQWVSSRCFKGKHRWPSSSGLA